jgi:DnaJ-class molecular chaperone
MSPDAKPSDRDRLTCTPCRGTGRVISNLGGERREVTCPWCEGSGQFKPGHDAQEHSSEPGGSHAGQQTPENRA